LSKNIIDYLNKASKTEDWKKSFRERPAKISVKPFFRASGDEARQLQIEKDTTVLGELFAEYLPGNLGANNGKGNASFDFLPPNGSLEFLSNLRGEITDSYSKESENWRKRYEALLPDFILCAEYRFSKTDRKLIFFDFTLSKTANSKNPFPMLLLPLSKADLEFEIKSEGLLAGISKLDVGMFEQEVFRRFVRYKGDSALPGFGILPALSSGSGSALDTACAILKNEVYYKLRSHHPESMYLYFFVYERMDEDKKFLYLMRHSLSETAYLCQPGKLISPSGKGAIRFSLPKDFPEGYPILFKLIATSQPIPMSTLEARFSSTHFASYLAADEAVKFLESMEKLRASGGKVYTADLTKMLFN
jgi:hypothetical protein